MKRVVAPVLVFCGVFLAAMAAIIHFTGTTGIPALDAKIPGVISALGGHRGTAVPLGGAGPSDQGADELRITEDGALVETLPDGTSVQLDDAPSRAQIDEMAIGSEPYRLRIPAVGIDTGMRSMSMYRENGTDVINPPTASVPYVVRDFASADDTDRTMVIAMHSIRGKPDLPGSRLIDIDHAAATVGPGDAVLVGTRRYTVTRALALDKRSVSEDRAIWRDEPGRLLLFTCLQRTSGRSVDNVVIEAQLDG